MAQKHYLNVREWPKTVSLDAQARIAANVKEESHVAAKLYWWREENGTPEGCAEFCNTLVAGALKRGRVAFDAAKPEVPPVPSVKLADVKVDTKPADAPKPDDPK